ncbi:hypothetical protein ZIOFF_027793 [Zingiber officinale]|uniref:Uncharacterized protein n=1 Tax=Zingiber officinale TaxID=94328 RepID=A0A8J5LDF7_ZINOF|nr:hypothetical protein ZIOFF_027793 [Zingiber officinale]
MISLPLPPLLLLLLLLPLAAGDNAYEVLRSNGLPIGLLPKGVRDFSIDADGRFQAGLDAPCTATFESEVLYNASISGTISPGQIAALSGMSAQDLFLWFPVLAIRLDDNSSGIIHFDVGVVDKQFPLSLFEVPPDCVPLSLINPSTHDAKSIKTFLKNLQFERQDEESFNFGRVTTQSPAEAMARQIEAL